MWFTLRLLLFVQVAASARVHYKPELISTRPPERYKFSEEQLAGLIRELLFNSAPPILYADVEPPMPPRAHVNYVPSLAWLTKLNRLPVTRSYNGMDPYKTEFQHPKIFAFYAKTHKAGEAMEHRDLGSNSVIIDDQEKHAGASEASPVEEPKVDVPDDYSPTVDAKASRDVFALAPDDPGFYEDFPVNESVTVGFAGAAENFEKFPGAEGEMFMMAGRRMEQSEAEDPAKVFEDIRQQRQNPNKVKTEAADHDLRVDMAHAHARSQLMLGGKGQSDDALRMEFLDEQDSPAASIYAVAVATAVGAALCVMIIAVAFGWYTLNKKSKAAADVDYPAYGVTGPSTDSSGDRRLAQSAHMYMYQHQKQQIIAMERGGVEERTGSISDLESEEENEEGDYTVYECPGFATTGEMEVKNPLFSDEPTPATPVTPLASATSAKPNNQTAE